MPYTTHGLMTAADMDEIRRDYDLDDLDLCWCCEQGTAPALDDGGLCVDCAHEH